MAKIKAFDNISEKVLYLMKEALNEVQEDANGEMNKNHLVYVFVRKAYRSLDSSGSLEKIDSEWLTANTIYKLEYESILTRAHPELREVLEEFRWN